MDQRNVVVGIFVFTAMTLFTAGLFLIGDQHKAFRRHIEFYTEFADLNGVAKGAKVRVAGMDAGQVLDIQIPQQPSRKFRLKLQVEDKVRGLIRSDSLVTIESAGVVGDKFLLIRQGSNQASPAIPNSTLNSKEPFEMGELLERASGLLNETGGTIADLNGKLDEALQSVTTTVNNTNAIVTDIRAGRGTAGLLLEDPSTAANIKQAIINTEQASGNLNHASVQVNELLNDFRSRNLFQKTEKTLDNAEDASQQVVEATQKINQTLTGAFGEDQFGQDAGSNLRQSLSNVNRATGNLADDTEALKHEFFFRGFFRKRGYASLDDLSVGDYREGRALPLSMSHREWLAAESLFSYDSNGVETLSEKGRQQIDEMVGHLPNVYAQALMIEGYANSGTAAQQLLQSRNRAVLVRQYLEIHFHLQPKNVGIIPMSNQPPVSAGEATWDGVCLVALTPRR